MESSTISLIGVVALLVANAFFVAAEFALVTVRTSRLEALAAQGSATARLTVRIRGNTEAYLAACQLGITMASLGLGWIGEPAVAALLKPLFEWAGFGEQLLHTFSFLVGFLVFSSLHIVVGEQVPKTFAIRKAELVALLTAYPLHGFYRLCYPLNWLLHFASKGILTLFRVKEATHGEVYSTDELRGLVEVSHEHGEMESGKAQMLANLLMFDQRPVQRIMIPRNDVVMLNLDKSAQANAQIMLDNNHSRYPVVQGEPDQVIGLVLVKDLYNAALAGQSEPWQDLKTYCRKPIMVPESLKVSRLFELMRTEHAHMAFAMDEYGAFAGLVTLEDLLEEIVGEIADEGDEIEARYSIVVTDLGWEAHGLVPLADVERVVGMKVEDELDANTLSGLFMQRLERMSKVGDSLVEGDYQLRVVEIEDNYVAKVAIEKIAQPSVQSSAEKPIVEHESSPAQDQAERSNTEPRK
jgi:CBS domain containing-hemolysin-like protein